MRRTPGAGDAVLADETEAAGTEIADTASKSDVLPTEDAAVTQPVALANIRAGAEPFSGTARDQSQSAANERAADERKALVQLCMYAWDRARSSGVAERIEQGLAGVGVTALRPDGERFDPAHHEAGGTVLTEDPALDGSVAETEVVGFSDRGQLLRAPIVIVYTRRTDNTA